MWRSKSACRIFGFGAATTVATARIVGRARAGSVPGRFDKLQAPSRPRGGRARP